MKKYLLIGLGLVIAGAMLVGDGIGIAAYLWPQPVAGAIGKHETKAKAKVPAKLPVARQVFVEIPKFVVTVPSTSDSDAGSAYLQLALSFMTEKKDAAADFDKLIPVIKSEIISDIMSSGMTLANKPMAMKSKIAADSLEAANKVVGESDSKVGPKPFFGCYITDYIIQ